MYGWETTRTMCYPLKNKVRLLVRSVSKGRFFRAVSPLMSILTDSIPHSESLPGGSIISFIASCLYWAIHFIGEPIDAFKIA